MAVRCFDNIPELKQRFDQLVDGKPESEHLAIGQKLALDYHNELFGELNSLKSKIGIKTDEYAPFDNSEKIAAINSEYQQKIDQLTNETPPPANIENSSTQSQTPEINGRTSTETNQPVQSNESGQEGQKSKSGISENTESNSKTSADGAATVPPVIDAEGNVSGSSDGIGQITLAANKDLRDAIGLPERTPMPETFEEWDAKAREELAKGYDMDALIKKMEGAEAMSPVENSIRKIYKATLERQIAENPTDQLLKEAKRYAEAEAVANAQAGKNLVSLKGGAKSMESLADFYVAKMQALNVTELTDKQKSDIKAEHEEVQKARDEYKAKWEEAAAKNAELEAQNALLKEKIDAKKGTKIYKDGKRDFVAERASLKDQLRKQVEEYKAAGNKLGISADGGAESFIITAKMAKTISEIVKSHVEEVGAKLSEVTKRTLEDVKDLFPSITQKDVHDVIAGVYNEKKSTRSELQAQIKDIQNEAKILNEMDRVLSGTPKTENAKVVKNQRLADLRKQLNDLKKDNSADQYSDAAKAKAAITANNKRIEQLQKKLADKDFAPEKPVGSFVDNPEFKKKYPKLYNEVLDSYNKKEEAQHNFDIGLYQDELKRRNILGKGLDVVTKGTGTIKAVVTGIDDSAVAIQTYVSLLLRPSIGAKALQNHALDFLSKKRFERELAALHNSADWKLIQESGLNVTEPKSLSAQNKEEIFSNRFSGTVKIKGKEYKIIDGILEPFERAFTSLGNSARVLAFRLKAAEYKEDGYTFEKAPELFKSLARRLNEQTGRGQENEYIKKNAELVTLGIWSPKLMASKFNMLGISDAASLLLAKKGTKGYYRTLHPKERAQAIKDVVRFAGSVAAISGAVAAATGGDVDWSPYSSTFLDIKLKNGKSYNLSGGFSSYIRTIFQIYKGGKERNGKFVPYKRDQSRGSEMTHFLRGKVPPITGALINVIEGKDFMGRPTDVKEQALNLISPISVQGITKQINEDGLSSIFTQGIPTFFGVNVKNEKDYKK